MLSKILLLLLSGSLLHLIILRLTISEFLQHYFEFLEVNLTVSVDIHLGDNVRPDCLLLADVVAKDGCDLLSFDRATAIFVEKLESGAHVRFT